MTNPSMKANQTLKKRKKQESICNCNCNCNSKQKKIMCLMIQIERQKENKFSISSIKFDCIDNIIYINFTMFTISLCFVIDLNNM